MRIVYGIAAALVAVPFALPSLAQAPGADRYWPQWRGPQANGISRTANPPIEWGENVVDDGFDASPALVDSEIYMRGYRYLYSLGAK